MAKAKSAKKFKKPLLIAGLAALLFVALVAGVAARWATQNAQNNGASGGSGSSNNQQDAQNQADLEKSRLPQTVEDVQRLNYSGKSDEAKKKIESGLNNPSTGGEEKYQLYIQEGIMFENQQNLSAARESYLKAYKVKDTQEITNVLGDIESLLGNKGQAVTYYKKSITQLAKDNPRYDAEKNILENKIRDNGGTL